MLVVYIIEAMCSLLGRFFIFAFSDLGRQLYSRWWEILMYVITVLRDRHFSSDCPLGDLSNNVVLRAGRPATSIRFL